MITINDLSFTYENELSVLKDVDLTVYPGEFVVLCGTSGSGKSTLLKIINGLIPELYPGTLSGQGTVCSQDMFNKNFQEYVKNIGMVFQNPKTQFFTSDVYSELAFSLENYHTPRQEMIERIQEVSHLLSLENFLDKSMFHLSGGEKQLVALASASMLKHQLFLLDEPSSNLDAVTTQQLRDYLSLLKNNGMTIVIAEHRLHYLTELADRYVILTDGQITNQYTRKEMLAKSKNELRHLGLRTLQPTVLQKKVSQDSPKPALISVVCQDITFSYKKSKASLSVKELTLSNNTVTGVIGHNGAGKSTFSKLISGLLKPTSGKILFNNRVMKPKQLLKESFVVMQDVNLQLFFETVKKELTFSNPDTLFYNRVVQTLRLEPLLFRHPQTLSGGEKQRVAIASALLSGKSIIIFDEPTSGLDLLHMQEVSKTIRWLLDMQILVLVISHDYEFIAETCRRVLHFDNGQIIERFFTELKMFSILKEESRCL